ncbi:hypothetical protein T440DRAFT_512952 [Plenodomus tracheiphilus IPT5]|uniref:Uncharacterized protein n=1 Tax=Plenodomus tracheiphilus IPT5 TaxID=1408161 RepID=A0A6A7BR41_9PLEO|nr:hypothetical protein T440DRAFT_512952 [Plenodomus tracheiphilus IPT5]
MPDPDMAGGNHRGRQSSQTERSDMAIRQPGQGDWTLVKQNSLEVDEERKILDSAKSNQLLVWDSTTVYAGDSESDISVFLNYAESVTSIFSSNSMTSSATELSRSSGYSASQIATASRELVSIFLHDRLLSELYNSAIHNPGIGQERLRRNLRRLLKIYARQLKEEASDALETLASQPVLLKAGALAQAIVDRFGSGDRQQSLHAEDDSSGDEQNENARPLDENAFHD